MTPQANPPSAHQWKVGETNVNFELPPVVKSIIDGHQSSLQTAGVLSGLLAGTSAQLYGFFKDPNNYSETTSERQRGIILALCYLALLLNIGATVGVFILIIVYSRVHRNAATVTGDRLPRSDSLSGPGPERDADPMPLFVHIAGEARFIDRAKVERVYTKVSWIWIPWIHWFITFFGGTVSLLLVVVIYTYSGESWEIRVVASFAALYCVSPLIVLVVVVLLRYFTHGLRFSEMEPGNW